MQARYPFHKHVYTFKNECVLDEIDLKESKIEMEREWDFQKQEVEN